MILVWLLSIAGGLTAATAITVGRLVAEERERIPAPTPVLAGDARWQAMSLNERDYARQRGWGQPDRVPLPAECMGPEELVAISVLRERVRSGRYGDDVMADHDLRRLQWGRYLVENGHIGEGSAEHGEDVQETSHEDDSRTA